MPVQRLAGVVLLVLAWGLAAPAAAQAPYETSAVSFMSGDLKIAGVLGRPPGDGPFPAYISNHGSMTVQAARGGPWSSIVNGSAPDALARRGYVVLIVARRGYRGSEGTTTTYSTNATSPGLGKRAVDVLRGAEAEVDDVLAALDYLTTLPSVDPGRIAVGGVSLGGLVSVMAAARDGRVKALVSMAGGYRQTEERRVGADEAWPYVQSIWRKSASRIQAATLILWSRNDSLVEVDVGRDLERQLKNAGKPVEMKVYPSFGDNGHTMFSDRTAYPLYVPDIIRFLDAALVAR